MQLSRFNPSANLLSTGQVLIASGVNARQVEFYQPAAATSAPIISNVSPNPLSGFSLITITVTGTNFSQGAVVQDNFLPLQTTFVSSTQLTAVLPQSSLLVPGNHQIQVKNLQAATLGTFTVTVINPSLQANASSLSFGNVNVGSSSATMSVRFLNQGNAPLKLDSLVLSGTNNDFAFDTGQTTCPSGSLTLAPLASCMAAVKFAPSSVGSHSGQL